MSVTRVGQQLALSAALVLAWLSWQEGASLDRMLLAGAAALGAAGGLAWLAAVAVAGTSRWRPTPGAEQPAEEDHEQEG